MQRAAAAAVPASLCLVDAVGKLGLPFAIRPIIHGDAISYSIAAASIVAKVTRDRQMLRLAETYPQYGLDRNKGYGTAEHIEAIRRYGPCPEHRSSFIGKFHRGEMTDEKACCFGCLIAAACCWAAASADEGNLLKNGGFETYRRLGHAGRTGIRCPIVIRTATRCLRSRTKRRIRGRTAPRSSTPT